MAVPENTFTGSGIFLNYEWFYCYLCSFREDNIFNIIDVSNCFSLEIIFTMQIHLITAIESFQKLRSRWPKVENSVSGSEIFLSHEWFAACLSGFGSQKNFVPGLHDYKIKWTDTINRQVSLHIVNTTVFALGAWLVVKKAKPAYNCLKRKFFNKQPASKAYKA
jgi:hypothetical protein